MDELKPAAFLSYVHTDDKYGHISIFHQRLSDEVQVHTGEEFPIFLDRNDIKWGQNWKERIEESVNEVTFLIPIITPSFFNSPACRNELQKFLEREKKLKREDLILPVYYVGCPLLDDEEKRRHDELAELIAGRQHADWRELRLEPFTNPRVPKTLAQLAIQIREALGRIAAQGLILGTTNEPPHEQSILLHQGTESLAESAETKKRLSAKTEPPIRIVDPMHRGHHTTITQAIEAASPGDKIIVRPGLYQEGLIIDKPLEIIGDGCLGEVIVQSKGKDVLLFNTTMGRVSNLTLKQVDGGDWYCVDITQGRLELEGCDITSQSLTCVAIHGGADPRLRRNRIHDGKQGGVYVHENGQGVLEDNDIFGNAFSGVEIKTGGNPTVRRNRINKNGHTAVFVHGEGAGTIEDNDLRDNAQGAWSISEDSRAKVTLARNEE